MRRARAGFTLIEILMAVVILVIVATAMARFAGSFSKAMGQATVRTIATGVATGRLELVRADPRYATLFTLYGTGSGADTTGFPQYPTMRRTTQVVRDQGGGRDRTTVTVRVWDPAVLKDTVSVSVVIASPE
jgi:prepilin-type N-terminal cleavage/methylation domain-containing protein